MTKSELIDQVSGAADISKAAAGRAIDALLDNIKGALADGQKVELRGFGSFERVETAARTGRNPKTGEPVEIPAGSRVKFKAGKDLK
ncbi:MAG: HU family DNA-binding protein [Pseudomonadota bacterium]